MSKQTLKHWNWNIGNAIAKNLYVEKTLNVDGTVTITETSASTGAVAPFIYTATCTGAGATGGRALFQLNANGAMGGWSNAIKGIAVYGASGKTTGLGSAVCAEIDMSAGTTTGTYAPLESELVVTSGDSLGTATSFLYCNVSGTGAGGFDDSGFFFEIGAGITADDAGAHMFTTADAAAATHGLRVKIDGTTYWLMLSDSVTAD